MSAEKDNVVPFPHRTSFRFDRLREDDKYNTLCHKIASGVVGGKLELQCSEKGKVLASQQNVRAFLKHYGVTLHFNQFSRKIDLFGVPQHQELSDYAFEDIFTALDAVGVAIGESKLRIILASIAREHAHNPLLDHINGLKWDGVARLDCLLVKAFGADDTPYVRAVTAAWFIGAVKRLRNPGCKHDYTLMLRGAEGLLKSTFFRDIAYGLFFTDCLTIGADPKKVIEQTGGKWIVEFAEATGLSRKETEDVKQFLTRQVDEERAAWGHATLSVPRQFVFGATTNKDDPLRGSDGNRRWWLVECRTKYDSSVLLDANLGLLNLIWAEAAAREAKGERNWLPDAIEQQAREVQKAATGVSEMQEELEALLADAPDDCFVSTSDLYRAVNLEDVSRRTEAHRQAVKGAMKRLGFKDKRYNDGRGFLKGASRQTVAQWGVGKFSYLSADAFAALQAENDAAAA